MIFRKRDGDAGGRGWGRQWIRFKEADKGEMTGD